MIMAYIPVYVSVIIPLIFQSKQRLGAELGVKKYFL